MTASSERYRLRARDNGPVRRLLFLLALGWTVLFLGVGAVAVQQELLRLEREWHSEADEVYIRVGEFLGTSSIVLEGFAAQLEANPHSSRSERLRFTSRVLESRPGWFLEVVDRVPPANLDEYIRFQRAAWFESFDVRTFGYDSAREWRPVRGKAEYLPIGFIDPLPVETRSVLGLDVSSEPVLFDVFRTAQRDGVVVATSPFVIAEGYTAYGLIKPLDLDSAHHHGPPQGWYPAFAELIVAASPLRDLVEDYSKSWITITHSDGGVLVSSREDSAETAGSIFDRVARFTLDKHFNAPFSNYTMLIESRLRFSDLNLLLLAAILAVAFVSFTVVLLYAGGHHRRAIESMRGQKQWFRLANFDSLTGLPNRNLLMDRLDQALSRAQRSQQMVIVLFLDLDGFKAVNDRFGHAVGDEVLRQSAERLRRLGRDSDTVARLGGDEFVMLLNDTGDPALTDRLVGSINEAFRQPLQVGERQLLIGVSIGIAVYPNDAELVDELLHKADLSMYRDKRRSTKTGERKVLDALESRSSRD